MVWSAASAMLCGMFLQTYTAVLGLPPKLGVAYSLIASLLLAFPVQIWVVKTVLSQKNRVGPYRLTLTYDETF
jgi:hypothetical protein